MQSDIILIRKTKSPKKNKITKIIAFPNITKTSQASIFSCDQVALKYWDGTQFQDEFPAGVAIGLFVQPNGFSTNDGTIGNPGKGNAWNATKYSSSNLNNQEKRGTIALLDVISTQMVTIGFEDGTDNNFSDATFYLDIEQKDAVEKNTIPDLPDGNAPTPDDNAQTTVGTLTYEDKWPEEGDYDMNDVMVDYESTIYKTLGNNKITKIIDKFTPRHNGGIYNNGFGYQLTNITYTDVKSVTIEGPERPTFIGNDNMESGQTYPTVILFDNIKNVIGKTYTVTIEIANADYNKLIPPYNPFIICSTDQGRGKEVHLVNYLPTNKADNSLWGTGEDASQPENNLFYVSAYPGFAEWVKSSGAQNKGWYLHKNE